MAVGRVGSVDGGVYVTHLPLERHAAELINAEKAVTIVALAGRPARSLRTTRGLGNTELHFILEAVAGGRVRGGGVMTVTTAGATVGGDGGVGGGGGGGGG